MQAVSVHARIKPPTADKWPSVHPSDEGVVVCSKHADTVLDGFGSIVVGSEQAEAYDAIAAPLVDQLLEGYSCTIMAYGQTGSGKTHTIFGPPGALTEAALLENDGYGGAATAPVEWGLFPRIALELLASGKGTLHASAVEVYQEKAFDLLADRLHLAVGAQKVGRQVAGAKGAKDATAAAPHKSTCSCRSCYLAKEEEKKARAAGTFKPKPKAAARQSFVELSAGRTNSAKGVGAGATKARAGAPEEYFATIGETRVLLMEPSDVARLARTIELTRTAVGHLLNARSSRSHCLVHLHLTEEVGGAIMKRQLLFVDLAGSERILRSGAEGVAAAQAVAINSSLTALGKVVRAVGQRQTHVPYRDSTLTQLLRSSLSGQSCTSVVIAVASDAAHIDESKCSLEFGQRMGAVRTKAAIVVGADAAEHEVDTESELARALAKLAEMEREGYAEKFGKAAMPGDIKDFRKRQQRIEESEADVAGWKASLAELKAQGNGGGRDARDLAEAIRHGSAEISTLTDLLARQKQVSGFWIPPRAVYTRTLAQVRELENLIEQRANLSSAAKTNHVDRRVARHDPRHKAPQEETADRWTSHVQDGKTFYYNEITGVSSWTLPVGVKRPLSAAPPLLI